MWRSISRAALPTLLLLAVLLLSIPIAMRAAVQPYIYSSPEVVPMSDAAIVLGASVARGKPSPVLKARAETAVRLYQEGLVSKILVTGDDSGRHYNEVTPVRDFLVTAGIPARDILLDHAGIDTYSSIYRARTVFGLRSATIVTQDFHMPRALYTARQIGIAAYGTVAGGEGTFWDYVREIPASIKTILDVARGRQPQQNGF